MAGQYECICVNLMQRSTGNADLLAVQLENDFTLSDDPPTLLFCFIGDYIYLSSTQLFIVYILTQITWLHI
jgi:hypothetical protein